MNATPRIARQVADWLGRHPSGVLLFAQLASLFVHASLDDTQHARIAFGAIALVVVPSTVIVVATSPVDTWVGFALAIPAMLLSFAGVAMSIGFFVTVANVLESALYFYAAYGLIRYMFKDRSVTADDLFAAGSTFTLLAWGFGYAFLVCQANEPTSFVGMVEPERPRRFLELLFLSVSTLSGVGNGDIIPVSSHARVLVMLEQIAGVGYIATAVSRLVGLGVARG